MPGFANTLREAWPKMVQNEGVGTFYKGLVPLWGRQIPYTMMKFACFEKTVELLYKVTTCSFSRYAAGVPRRDLHNFPG